MDARRQEGRRRLRLLVAVAVVAAIAGAALAALHSPLVRVRHLRVDVTGAAASAHLSDAQVVAAAGLAGRRLMIDVHSSQAEALIDELPWAAGARVVRQWPGTVRVTVHTRTAVGEVALTPPAPAGKGASAQLNADPPGGVALVDASGRVLERDGSAPQGLPVLGSLAEPGEAGTWLDDAPGAPGGSLRGTSSEVLAAASALPPGLAAKIWTVEAGAQGLQLTIGTTTVLFGDVTQLTEKVAALNVIVSQVHLGGIKTVDLRVPDRPALTPTSPTTSLSTTAGG